MFLGGEKAMGKSVYYTGVCAQWPQKMVSVLLPKYLQLKLSDSLKADNKDKITQLDVLSKSTDVV